MNPEIAFWDIQKIKNTLEDCRDKEFPDPEDIDEALTILLNYQKAIDFDDGHIYE